MLAGNGGRVDAMGRPLRRQRPAPLLWPRARDTTGGRPRRAHRARAVPRRPHPRCDVRGAPRGGPHVLPRRPGRDDRRDPHVPRRPGHRRSAQGRRCIGPSARTRTASVGRASRRPNAKSRRSSRRASPTSRSPNACGCPASRSTAGCGACSPSSSTSRPGRAHGRVPRASDDDARRPRFDGFVDTWVHAELRGDVTLLSCLLADDFVAVEAGQTVDKETWLARDRSGGLVHHAYFWRTLDARG